MDEVDWPEEVGLELREKFGWAVKKVSTRQYHIIIGAEGGVKFVRKLSNSLEFFHRRFESITCHVHEYVDVAVYFEGFQSRTLDIGRRVMEVQL